MGRRVVNAARPVRRRLPQVSRGAMMALTGPGGVQWSVEAGTRLAWIEECVR